LTLIAALSLISSLAENNTFWMILAKYLDLRPSILILITEDPILWSVVIPDQVKASCCF